MKLTAMSCRAYTLIALSSALLPLASCGGSSSTPATGPVGAVLAPGGATSFYVEQHGVQDQVLQFSANANGTVAPLSTLTLPSGTGVELVATDSAGQIYVAVVTATSYDQVLVYAAGASGSAAPLRRILGGPNSFNSINAIAVDSNGTLYVMCNTTIPGTNTPQATISILGPTADGLAAPVRTIYGPLTQLRYGFGLAIDKSGNLFAADTGGNNANGSGPGQINVFAPTANGNVAPVRVITGPLGQTYGMDTDATGNLYVMTYVGGDTISMVEFAAGATGAATPVKTIGGAASGLLGADGVRVDAAGNIFIGAFHPAPYVGVWAPSQAGNVAPVETIASASYTSSLFHSLGIR